MENLYQIPIKTKTLISFVDRFIHCVKYAWYILSDGTFVLIKATVISSVDRIIVSCDIPVAHGS